LPWIGLALLVVALAIGFVVLRAPAEGNRRLPDAVVDAAPNGEPERVASGQSRSGDPARALVDAPLAKDVVSTIAPASVFDPAAWPPLPPKETPLKDVLAQLQERADAGDHKAACRIALDLRACRQAIGTLEFQGKLMERRLEMDEGQETDMLQAMEHSLQRTEGCEGLPSGDKLMWKYTRQAARAGNVAVMEAYGFDAMNTVLGSDLGTAELKPLLAERDMMLLTAARAGSVNARQALRMRLMPQGMGLALDPEAGLTEIEREKIVEALQPPLEPGQDRGPRITGLGLLDDRQKKDAERLRQFFEDRKLAPTQPSPDDWRLDDPNYFCDSGYVPAPDTQRAIDWRGEFGLRQ